MTSVLIADDHALIRNALRELLEGIPIVTRIGEAPSGAEVLRHLAALQWDLVVLDIHMPGRSGIDILREIQTDYPETRTLILSGLPEKQYAVPMLRAGAGGYVSKEAASEELVKAIQMVLQGRRYTSAAVAELVLNDGAINKGQPMHARLSERERQVFLGLAVGRQLSAIAAELGITVKTVSTYRARLLEKLAMKNNAEMTAYALRNKLIEASELTSDIDGRIAS